MKTNSERILRQGFIAGLIGYFTIAAVFAVSNLVVGRSPFYTAAALGSVMFYGGAAASNVIVEPANVLAFNGVHLLAFLAFGIAGAWLVSLVNKATQLWYPLLFFWIFVAFHMIGAAQMMAIPVESIVPAGAIWGGGVLAGAAMTAYFLWANPRTRHAESWQP